MTGIQGAEQYDEGTVISCNRVYQPAVINTNINIATVPIPIICYSISHVFKQLLRYAFVWMCLTIDCTTKSFPRKPSLSVKERQLLDYLASRQSTNMSTTDKSKNKKQLDSNQKTETIYHWGGQRKSIIKPSWKCTTANENKKKWQP